MLSFLRAISLFVLALSSALLVRTAPLNRRQTGTVQCNLDRLGVVVGIQETTTSVNELALQLANTTFSSNITAAQTDLNAAQAAIDQIFTAVVANQPASPVLTNQVGGNLTNAATILFSLNVTTPSANATRTAAINFLEQAATAGAAVIRDCVA
ncbi:hypothetical protein BV25DRAFT_1826914 [Artomyces pyxidatus]|uniref:Uncharacterized protein n=1 Tax=Artomyces pyxidatus TaxID=48021 RepID=A0ACB8SYV8_9AGAM|nr:hypothetical protein BV25DRAFT_1826914 [Artomyces pyxidatus]